MNNCNVNKFVHTRYKTVMTVTDIDMLMHKKSKNHIRIIENKLPNESINNTQDDVLREVANIFKFAIDNGYKNKDGVPKLEVLKVISEPEYIGEKEHHQRKGEIQKVYDISSLKIIDYIDNSEAFYENQNEIDSFFLMEHTEKSNRYREYYRELYDFYRKNILTLF